MYVSTDGSAGPPNPLLGAGVHIKVVSELLGHADSTITLRLYSHVQAGMTAEAVRKTDRLLG